MSNVDHRPANGGGSCARCRDGLGLASIKRDGSWYCSMACAQARPPTRPSAERVPEPWLYARPRRAFRARRPKELRSDRADVA